MAVRIEGPLTSSDELPALELLWAMLHAHHWAVATYRPLVSDIAASWEGDESGTRAASSTEVRCS